MQIDMGVSGLFAGYFGGWLIRFIQHYLATSAANGHLGETQVLAPKRGGAAADAMS